MPRDADTNVLHLSVTRQALERITRPKGARRSRPWAVMAPSRTAGSTKRVYPLQSLYDSGGFAVRVDPPSVPPPVSGGQEQYRLYCLDGLRHITKVHEFHAKSDAEAIKAANAWRNGGKAELWCRDRKVHEFSASPR